MTKRGTTVGVTAIISVVALVSTGYLLYAVPSSDADRLTRQVATLRSDHARLVQELAAAQGRAATARRRAAAAGHRADAASARALQAYSQGHAKGVAEGAAASRTSYDQGYAAGSAAAFGRYGGNWRNGGFYVVKVAGGRVITRAALQPCLAVYAQSGAVWVQGPAC